LTSLGLSINQITDISPILPLNIQDLNTADNPLSQ